MKHAGHLHVRSAMIGRRRRVRTSSDPMCEVSWRMARDELAHGGVFAWDEACTRAAGPDLSGWRRAVASVCRYGCRL